MSYPLSEIIERIENYYPQELKLDWDNPGLIVGHADKPILRVLVSLDADALNIAKAIESNADLILTHHPFIFGSIRKINDLDPLGAKILKVIEHNIAVYSMHTNYDIGKDGMCGAAARRLGAGDFEPLMPTYETDSERLGVGFVYEVPKEDAFTAASLAFLVKERFGLDRVWYYDAGKPIRRIAVCPGSGRNMIGSVTGCRADAFITGDTGHHDGLDYKDAGITLIDAGHYGIEHVFIDEMTDFLADNFTGLKLFKGAADERIFV